jgi:hypothetical protein
MDMKKMRENFEHEADALLWMTEGCRDSMHEPDENGIYDVHVTGTKFDNAGFDTEMHLVMNREEPDDAADKWASFNLASLVAMARLGAQVILKK